MDASQATGWTDLAALLHIRAKRKGKAKDCGHGESVHAVFSTLRARLGMTNRVAGTRLASLRRSTHTTLQAHAMEVDRLVQLANEGLQDAQKLEMMVELFCSTIGNTSLHQHLLAVHTPDLESAVRAGSDTCGYSHPTLLHILKPSTQRSWNQRLLTSWASTSLHHLCSSCWS